ncbi:MAG: arylsulfatase [Verrucomicrobiales bacterium]|nr:arylsulfatase [Verrucomicrobiales bacterium]
MKSLLLAVLLSLSICLTARAESERPPNIVIVMPDDMGYGDLGATGNTVIRTPHLDRLASEAAELTNFYVSPVCSPTRACLMTGRYNHRTRCIDTFKGRSMMEPEEWTMAEALKEAGYMTGIFGKWHLGDNYPMRPQDQGFDEVLIHRGGGLAQPSEPIENDRRYTDAILFHNGQEVQTRGYCTDVYFDAAIEFMKTAKAEGKPFFVYLPPNAPHGPYHDVPEDLLAYYQSIDLSPILKGNESEKHKDTVARVFAMIENIDQNMGKMDDYLEKSGQKEETIVMFFTDNGPNLMRYVGPFRGMKSHVHEGGIRTMFYARWPEKLKAGTKSDRIAAHIDIMPTLLEIAGVEAPEGHHFDGKSVLPMWMGEAPSWEDRRIFIQSHRGNEPAKFHHFAVREENWKLVRGSGFGRETVDEKVPFELYQIREDEDESENLAEQYPEKLKELSEAYLAWLGDVSSTREDNYAPPRIRIGDDAETVTDLSLQDWRVPPDSAGWGTSGTWKVDFVETGPFQVSVKWAQPLEGEREVVLKVGSASEKATLSPGKTEVVFPEIAVGKGETDVSVHVTGEIKRDNLIRFVTFSRL